MREIINLNDGWYFRKGDALPERGEVLTEGDWEKVMIPHTWNAKDGQDGGNDYYRGICVYARRLRRPELREGQRVFLEFQAVAVSAGVFVNGRKVAEHHGGYSAFRVDVTENLEEENLLCVTADNRQNRAVYPQMADFTFYGGVYRDVNLILTEETYFMLEPYGTTGVRVTPEVRLTEDPSAELTCEAWVSGGTSVRFVCDRTGQSIEVPVLDGYASGKMILDHVRLWNGRKDPFLYDIRAELLLEGEDKEKELTDVVCVQIGCRKIEIDPQKGFLLNGKIYPLRGVARHQDRKGVGNAITRQMQKEDMNLILEMGANSIRLAHYQHAQEFYDLCDCYGILVWAEIPMISMFMEEAEENSLEQMRELVVQNYHHPSIYCWGLSNEISAAGKITENLLENHRKLNALCHELDPGRYTAMASMTTLEPKEELMRISDLCAYNAYFGWYEGKLEDNEAFFDAFHRENPDLPVGLTEYGADANIQYQSSRPKAGDYSESYQAVYHEHMLTMLEKRPWIYASYVWNMFEFGSDARNAGGMGGINPKGLVTFDRKIKKDAFYLYKAWWSGEPFVHICGKRYRNRAEEITEIKVYSNQPAVALYVDGRYFEKREGSHIFRFYVPIQKDHRIRAVAGEWEDQTIVVRANQPDPEYLFEEEKVVNWYDLPGTNPCCYSVNDRMNDILENPKTREIYRKFVLENSTSPQEEATALEDANIRAIVGKMTIAHMVKRGGNLLSEEALNRLNEMLQQVPK